MSVRLENSDGYAFVVEETVAKASELVTRSLQTIRGWNGDLPSASSPLIYVGSIESTTLQRVIKWMKNDEDLDRLNYYSVTELIQAAKLLRMKDLFVCATLRMANILNNPGETDTATENGIAVKVNSTPDTAPFPPVFTLLPEIWDFVLPHLSGTDLQSVINSIPFWRSTFMTQTSDKLLPLWLPIFLKHCYYNKSPQLIRWRAVNKAAKLIIDSLLEESVSSTNCYNNLDSRRLYLFHVTGDVREQELRVIAEGVKERYKFESTGQIQKFIDNMKSTSSTVVSNPFVNKCVDFPYGKSNVRREIQNHWETKLSLLIQYGHGISNLSIYIEDGFDLQFIASLLRHLPNLKVLTISCDVDFEYDEENEACWENVVKLDHLELLNVSGLGGFYDALLSPLFHCCSEALTTLICDDRFFEMPGNMLWQLELNLTLPLEEIHLIYNKEHFSEFTFNEIWPSLQRFQHSLVHLKLCIAMELDENYKNQFTSLPHLSKLTTQLGCLETRWFQTFVQLQAQVLTELVFDFEEECLPQEDVDELMELFQTFPRLSNITVLCGYSWFMDVSDAERVELDRNGTVRRFKFEYKDNHYPTN